MAASEAAKATFVRGEKQWLEAREAELAAYEERMCRVVNYYQEKLDLHQDLKDVTEAQLLRSEVVGDYKLHLQERLKEEEASIDDLTLRLGNAEKNASYRWAKNHIDRDKRANEDIKAQIAKMEAELSAKKASK